MITLLNDYYRIDKMAVHGHTTLFDITLLPDYDAYKGHFPGHPVAPAVCSIQMMRECAAQLAGQPLFLSTITKCRFSAMITPSTTPQLQLRIQLIKSPSHSDRPLPEDAATKDAASEEVNADMTYILHASLFDDSTTFIEFKGELTTVQK